MGGLSVAAAQTFSIRGDVAANVEHHRQLAKRAAEYQVDVVVFPELSLTGYELDIAAELAFTAEDERLAPLVRVANASDVTLIVGAPARLDSGLHIAAFVIEPGQETRVYTKQHLWGDEKAVFVPGNLDPLVALGDDVAALAICADTSHPKHAAAAARRGASLYLAGVFFDPDALPTSSSRLAGYAGEHTMTVVMANAGGPATGYAAAGRSAVWSESGALVASLEGVGAGLVVARRSERGWTGEVELL